MTTNDASDHDKLRHGIHELRNAMSTIIGNMDLLREKLDPDLTRFVDRCMIGIMRGADAVEALSQTINTLHEKSGSNRDTH